MVPCPTLGTGDAFLSSLLRHIDCQGQTIGSGGYQLLADSGSPLALVLTSVLTIFVALFGLRMILGEMPTLRDGVMAAAKVGVVMALATSWPAYRTVVYDVVVHGPAQLSAALGDSAGLPGTDGDLVGRLQAADVTIGRLINLGTGRSDVTSLTPAEAGPDGAPPRRAPIADDPAFGAARVVFLSSTVAAFAIVRLTAGVLLALAPLFAGFLLFEMTRGLFIGWARALVFVILASVAATILFAVQLTLLEPWLAQVLVLRQDRIVTVAAPVELLILCLGFALALAGTFAVLLRLAFTAPVPLIRGSVGTTSVPASAQEPARPFSRPAEPDRPAPRAHAVADALSASVRRERTQRAPSPFGPPAGGLPQPAGVSASLDEFTIPAASQSPRRTRPRKSLGAALRDRRS